jgi:pyridoxal phosphate enzyme (YggS family)
MSHYEKAWQDVRDRIARAAHAAGRAPDSVRLLAVSKTFPAEAVRAVYALGQRAFGENYVQEAVAKRQALADLPDVEWHLIGPLQSNKTADAADAFAWVESVDIGVQAQNGLRMAILRTLDAAGIAAARWPTFVKALDNLEASEIIRVRHP